MSFIKRHWQALTYVVTVILPVILRTGQRPVIFTKYAGIGDIICTIPAALELKKRHPGAHFIYNCHPEFTCLPRLGGVTSHTTSLESIGLVGHWYRLLLSGFYHFASDDDHPERVPSEVYIRDFGRKFGLDLGDDHPRLQSDPAVVERMAAVLGKNESSAANLVVIHCGPSWPVREWPRESWEALVNELKQSGFSQIVQVGTDHHLAMGKTSHEALSGISSMVNKLTLEETVAVIAQGALFVGIDSGLLHVAASVRVPSVGLWGPTSPQFRFSFANRQLYVVSDVECQGCHHRFPRLHWITGCPFDIKCMKTIEASQVLQTCLKGLA